MNYGLNIENQNIINNKARTKKNGCYKFRGVAYRVVDGNVTHFASAGDVYQQLGCFNVIIGSCKINSDEAHLFLKTIKA